MSLEHVCVSATVFTPEGVSLCYGIHLELLTSDAS